MTSEPLAELGPNAIVGSYRIVKEIGRGGMGTVYEAVHTILPRRAAIKVMHGELRRHPGMATRIVQEASILEDIRHPGIVRVYECNVLPDLRPWIAMELVQGETLASRVHYASRLPAVEVATLLSEVADVLASVHARGVVHRDLKPDNLLLTPSDRDFPLRVIDWGVARLGPQGRLTLDGLTPGTPIYMSPEQATGKNIAAPCDIYSLGVIAYEALTGHPPFDGRTLAEVVCMHLTSDPEPLHGRCDAPASLCQLIHRMLDKDPTLRPVSIEVRQIARAIALELASSAYEELEIRVEQPETPARPAATRARPRAAQIIPSDEVFIVDPDSLEFGITEMLPVVRKPRWTPELSAAVPSQVSDPPQSRPITPNGGSDAVAGEIVLLEKRR
ncbi:MAG TPA: serine/threonine-protein kinase [Kofleriaceae bacterium]|nr:serine/threonine-protein kinase [Kofleriaceae bacterium]